MLVDKNTIERYKAELTEEIEPSINELVGRSRAGLEQLENVEAELLSKVVPKKSLATATDHIRQLLRYTPPNSQKRGRHAPPGSANRC